MRILTNLRQKFPQGFIAPIAVVLLFVLLMLGAAAVNISANTYNIVNRDNLDLHAHLASDAGLEDALQNLNDDASWSPPAGSTQVMNSGGIITKYEVIIQNASAPNEKIIRSTGRTFRSSNPTLEIAKRIHEVVFTSSPKTILVGHFTVVAGPGGLVLDGSGTVGGNVYVGGALQKAGGSTYISPGSGNAVYVADNRCGSGASYPRICTSGDGMGQPITLLSGGSTIVSGTVYANNQTNTSGLINPGLTAGSVPAYKLTAPPDRQPIKNAITSTMTGAAASCTTSSSTKIWPANVKIDGNVDISNSSCTVIISGNVWITGDLTISGSGDKIRYDPGLTERPIIMIDGPNGMNMSGSGTISSTTGGYYVTYHSAASCSPECTDVTGEDLRNSIALTTIYNSINAHGNDFLAAWSTLHLDGSGGQRGTATGQRIIRKGSGTLPASVPFNSPTGTTGPATIQIKSYKRVFN